MHRALCVIVLALSVSWTSEIASAQTSQTCQFSSGPKSGQRQYFPTAAPVAIGSPCWDGVSSHGAAIADEDSASSKAPPSGPGSAASSQTCQFSSGPKSGQRQYFPAAVPMPIGSPCWDGVSSHGAAIADDTAASKAPTSAESTQWCQFSSGPKSGQRQYFPAAAPMSIGSPCWDGVSSHGTAVRERVM